MRPKCQLVLLLSLICCLCCLYIVLNKHFDPHIFVATEEQLARGLFNTWPSSQRPNHSPQPVLLTYYETSLISIFLLLLFFFFFYYQLTEQVVFMLMSFCAHFHVFQHGTGLAIYSILKKIAPHCTSILGLFYINTRWTSLLASTGSSSQVVVAPSLSPVLLPPGYRSPFEPGWSRFQSWQNRVGYYTIIWVKSPWEPLSSSSPPSPFLFPFFSVQVLTYRKLPQTQSSRSKLLQSCGRPALHFWHLYLK